MNLFAVNPSERKSVPLSIVRREDSDSLLTDRVLQREDYDLLAFGWADQEDFKNVKGILELPRRFELVGGEASDEAVFGWR